MRSTSFNINFPQNTNFHSNAFSEIVVIFSSLSWLLIVRGTVIISVGKDHRPLREHWTINSSTKNRIYILDCKLSALLRGSRFQQAWVSREREREQFAGVFVRVSSTAEYLVVCWTIPIARAGFKSLPRNPSTRRKRNIVVGTKIVCTEHQFPISRSLFAYFLQDLEISLVRKLRFIRVQSAKYGQRYCNIIRGARGGWWKACI